MDDCVFTWLVRAVFALGGSRISVVSSDCPSSSGIVARCCLDHSMSFELNTCSSSTIKGNSVVSMNIVFKSHATKMMRDVFVPEYVTQGNDPYN